MGDIINDLTPKQKTAGKICAAAAVLLCGAFLLLCGLSKDFPDIQKVWAVSILGMFFLIFLSSGIIQKNPVSIWIAFAFFTPALIEVLVKTGVSSYAVLYPAYIAIPAVASLVTASLWRNFKPHVPALVFFGGLGVLFALQSSGLAAFDQNGGWAVTLPAVIVFVGLCIVYLVLEVRRIKNED